MHLAHWIGGIALVLVSQTFAATTINIAGLPTAEFEDGLVCFDQVTGKLGRCEVNTETQDVTVNCPTDSIADVLTEEGTLAGTWLRITVNGTCEENVTLDRANTTLIGGTNGKIEGQTVGAPAIEVSAHNVDISGGLSISDGAGGGIKILPGGVIFLDNTTIENNGQGHAVFAIGGTAVLLGSNTLTATGTNFSAIQALEGASVAILGPNNSFTSAATAGNRATLLGSRRILISMRGDNNSVTNTVGQAISLGNGSTFRQDKGHATVNGDLFFGNMTNAEFRDVEITGDVDVRLFGSLRLRDNNSDGFATNTVTGTTTVGYLSNLDVTGTVRFDGDIDLCSGGTSSGDVPTFIGVGGFTICP